MSLEGGTFGTSEISFQGNGIFQWTSGTLHVGLYRDSLTAPNGGILAPGNSAGRTVVQGNYQQSSGATLDIELGGVLQGIPYDALIVQGNAGLGGNLQLSLLDGFTPNAATTFTILSAASVSGTFANVANGQRLATSDGLGSFIANYGPSSPFGATFVALSAFQAVLAGDYNQDGFVNAADYTVWRNHLGQTFDLPNKDPEALTPNVVDREDFNFWKARYAEVHDGAGATVPEPSTMVLLLAAVAGLASFRRSAVR